jgi:NAD(P)-dependent dehydrogenase (short-subunit alcohol dehydrogenase family)
LWSPRRELKLSGLNGKVAIVTGAGSGGPGAGPGIGQTIAVALARGGAAVLIVDKDAERADYTLREMEGLAGRGAIYVGDITRRADCSAMVRAAVETFGGLDILVNNAAVANHAAITETTEEMYDVTLAVNLKGTFLACQQAIPALIERGGGSIVNIGSIVGIRDAGTGETAYAASKAGQLGLTVELAGAYGRDNIRVNAVLPGLISTPMLHAISTRVDEVRSKLNLLGRMGEAADVANVVCFLCSDEAAYITAVTFPVDGGATMAMPASTFRNPRS